MKKISFIVYFPYQWFIYKNIYNKIPSGKREVIVDLNAYPGLQDKEVKENIISLLRHEGVFFRILERVDYFNIAYFQKFFSDVEVIVSCWELGCVSNKATKHIKKVNTTYGLAKELTMFRPTRSLYDVILAYGKRDQQYFGLLTKSIAIGNPRLDNFYNGIVDDSVREKIFAQFDDEKKKTILYIPTHGDLGTSHEMLSTFERLSKQYNIIFKPHYYTLREDRDIVEKYRKIKSILVIDDTWDTIEVMSTADVIVSDNSSSIFDAMQVDKPLVVCDFLDRNFLDVIHKNLRFIKRGIVGASTYSGGFEQEIKNKDLIATIKKPSDLDNILGNIEKIDDRYGHPQRELVQDNFEYTDGSSAQRATDIILSLYDAKREHIPGILHHAYLAYNNRVYRGIIESENKEISLAPNACTTIVWIFCESYSNRDEILGTLYSALSGKEAAYVCVSGVVEKSIIRMFSQSEFFGRISFFESHSDGLDFIYSQLSTFGNLFFVKVNTRIRDLNTIFNFKIACKRDMLFFFENVIFNPQDVMFGLFYLLKYEILGFRSLSKNTLVSVSFEQLYSIEKCAVFAESKVLLEHGPPSAENLSFDSILSFFIKIDSLKGSEQYDVSISDFILMPNFFVNINESESSTIFKKLVTKGEDLYRLSIPMKKWPDKKIGKFILEIIGGNFRYYRLLKLVFAKIFFVKKYVFFTKMYTFVSNLEKKRKIYFEKEK